MGQYFLDQYTLLHFAVGIVVYFWGIRFTSWIILHTLFEWLENTPQGIHFIDQKLGKIWPGGKQFRDSNINIIGDTVGAALGWLLAYWVDTLGAEYLLHRRVR